MISISLHHGLRRLKRLDRLFGAILLALVMSLAGTAAAASPAQPGQPRITIASVGRLQLNGNGATVDMTLDVHNPTAIDLTLTALTFRCDFEQAARAQGKSTATVMVPSNDHALVPVRLTVGNDGLNGLVTLLASGARSVTYKLDGVATIGPMMLDVPFTQSGKIALPH
jgi:LEA14-like dessication related protein